MSISLEIGSKVLVKMCGLRDFRVALALLVYRIQKPVSLYSTGTADLERLNSSVCVILRGAISLSW